MYRGRSSRGEARRTSTVSSGDTDTDRRRDRDLRMELSVMECRRGTFVRMLETTSSTGMVDVVLFWCRLAQMPIITSPSSLSICTSPRIHMKRRLSLSSQFISYYLPFLLPHHSFHVLHLSFRPFHSFCFLRKVTNSA